MATPNINTSLIQSTGQGSPVAGDPVVALVAQINRFQKAAGLPRLPATPGVITVDIASRALALKLQQLVAALAVNPGDVSTASQLQATIAAQGNPIPYVQANLTGLVQQLQAYADSQFGVPWSPFKWVAVISLGVASLAAVFLIHKRHQVTRSVGPF